MMPSPRTRSHVVTLFAGVTLLATLDAAPVRANEAATPVKTMTVEDRPATQVRRFFGRIAARDTLDLAFEVGGRMVRLDAAAGRRLDAGAVVAALDVSGYERAVSRARLALEQAEREFERASTLAERDVGSRARADDARTARDLAIVALAEADEALGKATLAAPFDALVAARLVPPFAFVEPGEPVVRLHDMSRVDVVFDLPERLLAAIGNLDAVSFSAELPGRDAPMELRFVEIRAEASPVGQTYSVTLAFPGEATRDERLLPGSSVTVVASLTDLPGGVSVPATALVSGPDRSAAVMIVEGTDPAVVGRRPVVVRSATGSGFVVEGLAPGAEIVAAGAHLLRDGQAVRRWTGLLVEER